MTTCSGRRDDREHVLVTGASGLTGRALCAALAPRFIVHAASRTGVIPEPRPEVCTHVLDLADPWFETLLPSRVDHVVHLAQSRRYREFHEGARDMFEVNVASTARLLEWARVAGARHVTLASSGSVYAESATVLRESDPLVLEHVNGFYAASKLAAEILSAPYAGEFDVTLLRPFFIYGKGQDQNMLLPRLLASVRDKVPVRLSGHNGFRFTPTHVSDVVRAVEASFELTGAHVINVGGPEVLTLRTVCAAIGRRLGEEPVFHVVEEAPNDLVPDLTRMHHLLASPKMRFDEGLALL